MAEALKTNGNRIDGVIAANDSTAGGVIEDGLHTEADVYGME
jgi:ABC-type xylose transport system substrate-binding protein